MKRIYIPPIQQHLRQFRQMVFLSGPRQVGKTTLSKTCLDPGVPVQYLNWDNLDDRALILKGIDEIYAQFQPAVLKDSSALPVIIFDEIHKHRQWKTLLKGYYDTIHEKCKIIVTGSARLNIFRRGGDSMMGRYFLYRVHPLSVAEIIGREDFSQEIGRPSQIDPQAWQNLLTYGGFPEPYLQAQASFFERWSRLKQEQAFQEDLRELTQIHEVGRLELLAQLLSLQIGSTTKYSELAKKVRVSEPTVRKWMDVLQNLYYCFSIPPWSKNVSRSLLKEPKIYLWDWSQVTDKGARLENLVACHLHKAVNFWTDIGLGSYGLYYLRDKEQREVDFLITKNQKPWIMIEVKAAEQGRLNPNLHHFNKQLQVPHAFQAVESLPYVDKDCFSLGQPMVVPLLTLLSQLV